MKDALGFDTGDLVVVTGAGSGIGRATARLLASLGLEVAAWDLDGDSAEKTAAEIGGMAVEADVTDEAQVATAFGRLSQPARFLVNNAGPPSAVPTPFADGLAMAAGSVALVTAQWLRTAPPEPAAVVNVASVAGTVIGSRPDWYVAAKAAVAGYTRHLAIEHGGRLRANAVAPGMVATPRSAGFAQSEPLLAALARNPLGRMGEPEEIAGAIAFLLSPLASYVNGAVLTVDGGWTIAP